jgi:hypothetical protein
MTTIELDAAAQVTAPRPVRRRVAVAGVVVLLAALAVAVRGSAGASAVLRAAAAAAERSAMAAAPGEVRFVELRESELDAGLSTSARYDHLVEEWIPADPRQQWLRRVRQLTPLPGSGTGWDTRVAGAGVAVNEWQGLCGEYFPEPGADPCSRPGLWQDPTPAFVAGLPEEPVALLARLRGDATIDGTDPDQESLLFAASALERGVPVALHARVYRALALLPGLTTARRPAEFGDGRAGVIVFLEARGARVEFVVDPATGAFLGWRRVLTAPQDGLPAGTVTIMKVVRTAVVSTVGRRPGHDRSGQGRALRGAILRTGPDARSTATRAAPSIRPQGDTSVRQRSGMNMHDVQHADRAHPGRTSGRSAREGRAA